MPADTDQQLVEKVLGGNKNAFDMLVLRHQNRVAAIVARIIRDPKETEDVCQEAFIKAYMNIGCFKEDSAFFTWLYRIAVNTAKNHLSSKYNKNEINYSILSVKLNLKPTLNMF